MNTIVANGTQIELGPVPYSVRWEANSPTLRFGASLANAHLELNLTPKQAREIARLLIQGADFIEAHR